MSTRTAVPKESPISKRRRKILYALLGTKSLEDWLPIYTAAQSKSESLFDTLPRDLINPVRESLRDLQDVVGVPNDTDLVTVSDDVISRTLSGLNGSEFISYYLESLDHSVDGTSEIPEAVRASAEWWLNELLGCITGKNGLFSKDFDPETYVDGFVKFANGQRITDILGPNIESENADYFFRGDNVVVELKILETDFLESNREKLAVARAEALKKVKITPEMILGTDQSQPEEVFWAEFRVLRDALQRITKKGNDQIKNSRQLLNANDASGIVVFLVDGFYSVSPFLIIEMLHDPVTRQFSGVDAIIVLTFRRKVTLDYGDGPFDYFVFEPRYSPGYPKSLPTFVDNLGSRWFEYMQRLSGKKFSKHFLSHDSRNLLNAVWKEGS